jgi:hypothetical protein
MLWDELVEAISISVIIPQLHSKIELSVSDTELNSRSVPLVSFCKLKGVHHLDQSTLLCFGKVV